MNKRRTTSIFITLSIILGTLLVSCTSTSGIDIDRARELESKEIRNYQGENLSSILDFRENSIRGPQYINIEDYRLEITGLVENPIEYTYAEIITGNRPYKKIVTLNCVEGWSATILWEGILLRDLIRESIPSTNATVVIFQAYDGYTTSFQTDYIMKNDIIIAYKINDVTLPQERGFPFQLVAESKWGYKWIKWITKIELSDVTDYQGYWESRGYSNSANLDEDFLE
ncbi:molybdopterin-dependent oxidoreductase [Chloroflexota bacterium]